MKSKITIAVGLFLLSFGAGIYASEPSAACPFVFRILAFSFAAFGLWNFIGAIRRSRPFRKDFRSSDWVVRTDPPQSYRDVVVLITAQQHGKGSAPRLEFLRNGVIDRTMLLVAEIAENGDVSIYHSPNSFMPPGREFGVEIRG